MVASASGRRGRGGRRRGLGVGRGGVARGPTNTTTVPGLTETSPTSAGSSTRTGTSCCPSARPVTSNAAVNEPGSTAPSACSVPPIVTVTLSAPTVYVRSGSAPTSTTPAERLRVASSSRNVTVTLTAGAPTAVTPSGRSSSTATVTFFGGAVDRDRHGRRREQRRQHVGVPGERDHARLGGRRLEREPGCRLAGDDRRDRHGPGGDVAAHLDPHANGRRLDLHRGELLAPGVHGDQVDELVDVDPGRLDPDAGLRGDDLADDRLGPRHVDALRGELGGRRLEPLGDRGVVDLHRNRPGHDRVEADGDPARPVVEDVDGGIGGAQLDVDRDERVGRVDRHALEVDPRRERGAREPLRGGHRGEVPDVRDVLELPRR